MNTRKSKQIDSLDMLSPNNSHLAANISSTTHVYPCFSSPNLTSFENGLLNGLTDIDMSANGLSRSETNKAPAIIISKTNSSQTSMNSNDMMGNQYLKKTIIDHNQQREEELKIKENYLNQLKSIDIKKFSYPNE